MPSTKELWDRVNVSMPEAVYMTGYSRQRLLTLLKDSKVSFFREQAGTVSDDPDAGEYVISVKSLLDYFEGRFSEKAGAA